MAAAEDTVKSPNPEPGSNPNPETQNKAIVDSLYKALAQGLAGTVARLLASDLEWWFHGPPHCNHMMKVLTGEPTRSEFRFEPRSITAIGDCVIVEGWEGAQAYWVHVWSLKDGLIMQFREYFNTWLTVRDIRPPGWEDGHEFGMLWQSQPRDLFKRSLPGILLAM